MHHEHIFGVKQLRMELGSSESQQYCFIWNSDEKKGQSITVSERCWDSKWTNKPEKVCEPQKAVLILPPQGLPVLRVKLVKGLVHSPRKD